jgi:transposase
MKVSEIAAMFDVSPVAVYIWIAKGLPYQTIREPKKKPYKTVNPDDVKKFLNLSSAGGV